jgi:hypothetical protein
MDLHRREAAGGRRGARFGVKGPEYRVHAKLWRYPGKGGWHFMNLSPVQSEEIRIRFGADARGWGSLPATIRIGKTEWRTSLFPDKKTQTYLFAVKSAVRNAEEVEDGEMVDAVVRIASLGLR